MNFTFLKSHLQKNCFFGLIFRVGDLKIFFLIFLIWLQEKTIDLFPNLLNLASFSDFSSAILGHFCDEFNQQFLILIIENQQS